MRSLLRAAAVGAVLLAACGGDDQGSPVTLDAGADATPDAGPPPIDAAVGPPAVAITSHQSGHTVIGPRTQRIAGTLASDGQIAAVQASVDGGAAIAATFDQTSFTVDVPLGDNDTRVVVTATDGAGQTGQASVDLHYPFVRFGDFPTATIVLGQTDAASAVARAADAARVGQVWAAPEEIDGVLYAADDGGNRILGFRGFPSATNAGADFVVGQPGFDTSLAGVSAIQLHGPRRLVAHGGRAYAIDLYNNRVLVWASVPTATAAAATLAIGPPSIDSAAAGCAADRLDRPEDLAFAGDKLIVSDSANNRILIWNAPPAAPGVAPDLVLGQASLTTCAANDDDQNGVAAVAPTARTLRHPVGLWTDGTRLVVADQGNHRVLVWNQLPTASFTPADVVIGQSGFTAAADAGGAAGMSSPTGVESNGNQLFVTDQGDHRVQIWNQFPTASSVPADGVIGQSDLQHIAANDDDQDGSALPRSGRVLSQPAGIRLIRDRLFVGDAGNRRLLVFGAPVCPVDTGQYELPAGSGTCVADPCVGACTGQAWCDRSSGAAQCVCPAGLTEGCTTCVRYVDGSVASDGFGLTWGSPWKTLQPAIAAAVAAGSCQVWIKEGTYHVYQSAETDTISLSGAVTVRGGFAGDEDTVAARHGGATILDGQDAGGTLDVLHVVTASANVSSTLEHVTIRHGNADGSGNDAAGGGLRILNNAIVRIDGVTFDDNRAGAQGGAIASANGNQTIVGSVFTGNRAGTVGGAALLNGGVIQGSTFTGNRAGTAIGHTGGALELTGSGSIADSVFERNQAGGDAGAVHVRNSTTAWSIDRCTFVDNHGQNGGALYYDAAGGVAHVRDSLFAGNRASGGGGAIFLRDSGPSLSNLTIAGNVAGGSGNGLLIDGSSAAVANLIVWGNAAGSGATIGNLSGSLRYSDIQGGAAGTGNLDVAPRFVHAPAAVTYATAIDAGLSTLTVASASGLAVGDWVEVGDDGVARQIMQLAGTAVTVAPALAASPAHPIVEDWAGEHADLAADYRLAAGSPAIDAGDGGAASTTDLAGHARTDDAAVTDTGTGSPSYVDLGCYEH